MKRAPWLAAPTAAADTSLHEQERGKRLRELHAAPSVSRARERGCRLRVTLVVGIKARLVCPEGHFLGDQVVGSSLVDPRVQPPSA